MSYPVTAPNRRWFRFSLRMLFVVLALVSLPLCWIAYDLHWIRQRHDALTWFEQRACGPVGWQESGPSNTLYGNNEPAPWGIRILGEPGYAWIWLDIAKDDAGWGSSEIATKEEIKSSKIPRVRQFLDREPETTAKAEAVAAHFHKYLQTPEAKS